MWRSAAVIAIATLLPYVPFGVVFEFVPLPDRLR